MCGICFTLNWSASGFFQNSDESLIPSINRRGPDFSSSHSTCFLNETGIHVSLTFFGSVLHIRGQQLTQQPLVNKRGDVLLWNGEIFGGIDVRADENDTKVLFDKLSSLENADEVLNVLAMIQGPWALVYFNMSTKMLWYGRDYLGRRSLLCHSDDYSKTLVSVGCKGREKGFEELPCKFVYTIHLNRIGCGRTVQDFTESRSLKPYLLTVVNKLAVSHRCSQMSTLQYTDDNYNNNFGDNNSGEANPMIRGSNNPIQQCQTNNSSDDIFSKSIDTKCFGDKPQNYSTDNKSQSCQVVTSSNDGDNISTEIGRYCGDNDSRFGHELQTNRDNIDYLNDKQLSTIKTCNDCGNVAPNESDIENTRMQNLSVRDYSCSAETCEDVMASDCGDKILQDIVPHSRVSLEAIGSERNEDVLITRHEINTRFLKVLEDSVRRRVLNVPRRDMHDGGGAAVGILFSGGIDSVVLAALADRCLPESEQIDLINVAFEQKYKVPQNVKKKNVKPHDSSKNTEKSFDVPDRITGRNALKELNESRNWNFIEVNVTLKELQKERQSRISNLVYPLETVLDDSIGCAIWFAARGIGKCYKVTNDGLVLADEQYKSPVKVLLTGMGADEQLGGYARHRTRYEKQSWSGLRAEMEMELDRISSRNMGRDDRCISDHGREARFPFLDEQVINFLKSIPVCSKCDPRLPRGVGEKILLREVALDMLGLIQTSRYPKRAIQFGSRIAKLESGKEKGGESCERLK